MTKTFLSASYQNYSLQKQPFLFSPIPLGMCQKEECVQCLHNNSGSHGVLNANLLNSMFLLVDLGKALCSFANIVQENSRLPKL